MKLTWHETDHHTFADVFDLDLHFSVVCNTSSLFTAKVFDVGGGHGGRFETLGSRYLTEADAREACQSWLDENAARVRERVEAS